jgi:hypothetical protein
MTTFLMVLREARAVRKAAKRIAPAVERYNLAVSRLGAATFFSSSVNGAAQVPHLLDREHVDSLNSALASHYAILEADRKLRFIPFRLAQKAMRYLA